jgi:hypothetical protein
VIHAAAAAGRADEKAAVEGAALHFTVPSLVPSLANGEDVDLC